MVERRNFERPKASHSNTAPSEEKPGNLRELIDRARRTTRELLSVSEQETVPKPDPLGRSTPESNTGQSRWKERTIALRAEDVRLREAVAALQTELLRCARFRPAIATESTDIFNRIIHRYFSDGRISEEYRDRAYSAIQALTARCAAVHEVRHAFPDDAALYEHLFGAPPSGRVVVRESPSLGTLYFQCFDPLDYARIYFGRPNVSVSDLSESSNSGGLSILLNSHGALNTAIIAENSSQADSDASLRIYEHESIHAFQRLFGWYEPLSAISPNELCKIIAKKLRGRGALPRPRVRHAIEQALESVYQQTERNVRGELLAYDAAGFRTKYAVAALSRSASKNGLHDYFQDFFTPQFTKIAQTLLPQYFKNLSAPMRRVFRTRFKARLTSAYEALRQMDDLGYTLDTRHAYLMHEPLERWGKIVRHLAARIKERRVELPMEPVRLTGEDFSALLLLDPYSAEHARCIASHGLVYGSGIVRIFIDEKPRAVCTNRSDFGTEIVTGDEEP